MWRTRVGGRGETCRRVSVGACRRTSDAYFFRLSDTDPKMLLIARKRPPTRPHVPLDADTYLLNSFFERGKNGIPAKQSQLPVADSFVGPAAFTA